MKNVAIATLVVASVAGGVVVSDIITDGKVHESLKEIVTNATEKICDKIKEAK